jgi:hypothetical protein
LGDEYIFVARICEKAKGAISDGETNAAECTIVGTNHLSARMGERSVLSNRRGLTYQGKSADGSRITALTTNLGYDFAIKPLYFNGGSVVVQYEFVGDRVAKWSLSKESDGKNSFMAPTLDSVSVMGTQQLKEGESFQLDKAGLLLDVYLLKIAK